jgi:hypothetical protein
VHLVDHSTNLTRDRIRIQKVEKPKDSISIKTTKKRVHIKEQPDVVVKLAKESHNPTLKPEPARSKKISFEPSHDHVKVC